MIWSSFRVASEIMRLSWKSYFGLRFFTLSSWFLPVSLFSALTKYSSALFCQKTDSSFLVVFCVSSTNQYLNIYPILSFGFWVSQHILLLKLIFFRSSKERFRDQDLASRDRDRNSRDRSPRDRDRKDKKRSYESANGRSEDRRSSEEREAGEI